MKMKEWLLKTYADYSMSSEDSKVTNSHPLKTVKWDLGLVEFVSTDSITFEITQ